MKNFLRIAAFALVFIICFSGVYHVLSLKDTMGLTGSSINQLGHTPDDTIDVVFLGSSHVYYGISPSTLWSEYGYSSFDMAISAMDKGSAYHHLKYLLKTQSPKVVFVDLYPLLHDRHQVEGNVYRNLLGMPYSLESLQLVLDYTDKEDRADYITKFPIIHTRYAEVTKEDFYDSGFAEYGRGERIELGRNGGADFSAAVSTTEKEQLSDANLRWLDNMCGLADKYGFSLIFYVTPFSTTEEEQAVFNAVKDYASTHNTGFMDLSKVTSEIGLDSNGDFVDPEHMNVYGAAKTTRYLGEYLKNNYSLDDHRGDDLYSQWNQDAVYQAQTIQFYTVRTLVNEGRLEEALTALTSVPGISYIVSLEGTWQSSTLPLASYVENLGISCEESANGGVWIGSGGINSFLMDNNSTEVLYYSFDRYSTARICRTQGNTLQNILVGYESAQLVYNGLSVAVYDLYSQKLIPLIAVY